MKLEPIITEKSMNNAKEGKYTFRVGRSLNKIQIKKLIEETFGVHVTDVKTIRSRGGVKRTPQGRKRIIQPAKKAIVTLKDKEKIDLFEESKK